MAAPSQPGGAPPAQRDDALLRILRRGTEGLIRFTLRGRYLSLALAGVFFLVAVAILGVSIAGIAPLIRVSWCGKSPRSILADGPGYARSAAGSAGFVFNEDYEQEFGHNLGTVTVPLPDRKERAFQDPSPTWRPCASA